MIRIIDHLENDGNLCFVYNKNNDFKIITKKNELQFVDPSFDTILKDIKILLDNNKWILIGYDLKDFFSSALSKIERENFSTNRFTVNEYIDLKYLEKFNSINKECPNDYNEIAKRLKECGNSITYSKKIHSELAKDVIPFIERNGIIIEDRIYYSYYEIEGQITGRLNCKKVKDNNYIPYTQDLKKIKPIGFGKKFLYVDYKNLEPKLIAFLTKDKNLTKHVENNELYQIIADNFFSGDRNLAKKTFLSVFYGVGSLRLANMLQCGESAAESIIENISRVYSQAWEWFNEVEKKAKKGMVEDCVGRKNYYNENYYSCRSRIIQSPASAFCQEKLIDLYKSIKDFAIINCSIHDGFLLSCDVSKIEELLTITESICSSESKIILNFKNSVKFNDFSD